MTKIVAVALESIACTNNGFGGTVQISGNTFGSTFQNNPDIPAELRDTRTIFPFPAGPISIAEGETKSITMARVRFSLSTPSHEPPDLNPKVLKVVGELNNGLGSNAFLIRFDDPLPFAPPSRRKIRRDSSSTRRRPISPSRSPSQPLWCTCFEPLLDYRHTATVLLFSRLNLRAL